MTPPHFCDYLPFEEDLALHLNNLEFPLPKSLIEIGLLVLKKKFFSQYKHVNMVFPIVAPPDPWGP
jgi:hypothetical protein